MQWSDYVYVAADSPTGLRWKVDILDTRGHQTKARKDGIAGGGTFRYLVQVGDFQQQCSRVVFELINGPIVDGMVVDHKDGNPLNNDPANLVLKTLEGNNRNVKMSSANSSGKTGVFFSTNRIGTPIYVARWYENGRAKSRSFSTLKYGTNGAFDLAANARDEAIKNLNAQGAGYTERHGK